MATVGNLCLSLYTASDRKARCWDLTKVHPKLSQTYTYSKSDWTPLSPPTAADAKSNAREP